jgi:polyphosphate glucokinase
MATLLGIDVGGSGIKGATVDTVSGELVQPRFRIPTPEPATPEQVAQVVKELATHFEYAGKIGVGFPAVVHHGVAFTAANIDKSWIGTNVSQLLTEATGCPTTVLNDADAAGLAEMKFGAGKEWTKGVVFVVTVGTGLGTAVFVNGQLFPNTELGHIEIRGKDAELRASDANRQRKEWSWEQWAIRLNEYFQTLERLMSPDLFIVGGGVSKDFEKISPYISLRAQIVKAQLLNEAGIVGAALAAEQAD